jgi:uncharacterized protein YunC (DUF1805 family)
VIQQSEIEAEGGEPHCGCIDVDASNTCQQQTSKAFGVQPLSPNAHLEAHNPSVRLNEERA